jgi:hypothetical protein
MTTYIRTVLLGVLMATGCPDDGKGGADEGDCPVGSAGCHCTVGAVCDEGLMCISQFCIEPGAGSSPTTTNATNDSNDSNDSNDTNDPSVGGTNDPDSGPMTSSPTDDSATATGPGDSTGPGGSTGGGTSSTGGGGSTGGGSTGGSSSGTN